MTTREFQQKKPLSILFTYFKPHRGLFILDLVCATVVALIDLAFPLVTRKSMYDLLPNQQYRTFFIVMGVMMAAFIVRALLYYVISYWGHTFGILVEADIRRDLFTHVQELDVSFFDHNRTGQLMSRLTSDLFEITELAHHGPEDLFISVVTIVGALIVMFCIRWELALVLLVMLPVLLLAGLLDTLCAQQKLRGAGFTVAVPADAAQAALLQDKGFAKAFALRCLSREVSRNLWSQAEFDTVTAKKLCELREQFWKDTVQLSPERMAVVWQELYARGATIVSNEHGYGIYFRKEDTLYFVEMMADSDRAAEILMEAAREKEVIVEKAVITVGAAQPLFLGEGTRQEYGMIRFDAEPFDISESYLRLMLEN